jgi:hypothetical protein
MKPLTGLIQTVPKVRRPFADKFLETVFGRLGDQRGVPLLKTRDQLENLEGTLHQSTVRTPGVIAAHSRIRSHQEVPGVQQRPNPGSNGIPLCCSSSWLLLAPTPGTGSTKTWTLWFEMGLLWVLAKAVADRLAAAASENRRALDNAHPVLLDGSGGELF